GTAFEPSHNRVEHLLSRHTGRSHLVSDSLVNFWQRFGKIGKPPEFIFIAQLAPTLVITVLLSPPGIATRRLDMSGGRRTNPNVRPCRRNRQTLNSEETLLVADSFALRI